MLATIAWAFYSWLLMQRKDDPALRAVYARALPLWPALALVVNPPAEAEISQHEIFGPALVLAGDLPPGGRDLRIQCRVNGVTGLAMRRSFSKARPTALRWPLLVLAMTWYSMRDRLGL